MTSITKSTSPASTGGGFVRKSAKGGYPREKTAGGVFYVSRKYFFSVVVRLQVTINLGVHRSP